MISYRRKVYFLVSILCFIASAGVAPHLLFAWGGLPHQQIIDGALTAIAPDDQITLRLGSEVGHLRDTVEMGDWVNSLIMVQENWHVTTEDYPQIESEYFGNDYLLFPAAPHFFNHMMPEVHGTYAPFFLRTLQALRTEDQENAARWMGSLLHFVTDSGSPPHAIGLSGPNHTKMENWLDASRIDLREYSPSLLGHTDEEAVEGLQRRMDGLIARNAVIARRMLPYGESNDRAHIAPMALDCAEETARVTADVIHTLLALSSKPETADGASIFATVTAPALAENQLLPAKLVLLGTNFSTLSALNDRFVGRYSGTFSLRNLPAGTYRAAIERSGAVTFFVAPFTLAKGQQLRFNWNLDASSPPSNLVQNDSFALRWISPAAPDHWHHDDHCHCWLSDNMPVTHGHVYRASILVKTPSTRKAAIEWMALHWKTTDDSPVEITPEQDAAESTTVLAPPAAVYARIAISGDDPPQEWLRDVAVIPATDQKIGPLQR
jgi:hypothetical protein